MIRFPLQQLCVTPKISMALLRMYYISAADCVNH